ncbi:MAG: hypothetical protein GX622_14550, partial [Bacteroidales bacterium]|nr:hypothetical protein [Bacteroidales bacterium]
MKKGTKIALWVSIPLVLLIWFTGPRIGLWGNRDLKKKSEAKASPSPVRGQTPGGQPGAARPAGGGQGTGQGGGQLPVNGTIAKPSYLTSGIRSAGSLLANEEVDIVSKVSGKVTGVFFREG